MMEPSFYIFSNIPMRCSAWRSEFVRTWGPAKSNTSAFLYDKFTHVLAEGSNYDIIVRRLLSSSRIPVPVLEKTHPNVKVNAELVTNLSHIRTT